MMPNRPKINKVEVAGSSHMRFRDGWKRLAQPIGSRIIHRASGSNQWSQKKIYTHLISS